MKKIPVIIDCDPGVDDTAALLLAHQMPELEILAVTTVAGNVSVDKTTINAMRVRMASGAGYPVFSGAEHPMFREPVTASGVHGEDGFGGVEMEIPDDEIPAEKAWDAMYRIAKEQKGELTIVATGPMTNLGIALSKYKELPQLVKRIVIMGGAAIGGNVTPAAEFNIYVDPEAADMLFQSGIPVYMCGLDVTMKAYITPEELKKVGALGSPQAKLFHDVFQNLQKKALEEWEQPGVALHDPVAVMYAADDSIFETHHVGIRVETKGEITLGKTVTDLYSDKQMEHNAYIVMDVDRDAFLKKVMDLMAKY